MRPAVALGEPDWMPALWIAGAVFSRTALLLWRRVVTVEELAALRGVVRRTALTPT